MNKHDFYKELMSEYSFDAEKIKANAKRGKFARQKIAPLTIGITAAVAACTVAVGTLAMTMIDNNNGVSLVDDSSALSAKSDTERLKDAMARLEEEKESSELKDVLVTFAYTLSPTEAQNVLTAYTDGSVPVKALFFADGTRTVSEADIAAVFSANTAQITGAAINCSGIVAAELAEDSRVYLVENMTEEDFENALPVDVESLINNGEDTTVDVPEISDVPEAPLEPADPVIPSVDPDDTTIGTAEVTDPEENEDPESIEVSEDEINDPTTSDDPEESSTPADTSTTPEETTQPSSTEDTEQPVEPTELTAAVMPEGITLPTSIEAVKYEPMVRNAESAFFIDDYVMYVKKSDGFGIYTVSAGSINEIDSVECVDAVVHWISTDGDGMLISGKTDKDSLRNKLWYVSSVSQTITDLNAEDSVMDGALTNVGYNEDSKLLVMSIKEEDMYYLSAHILDDNGNISYISDPFQSASKITLMCAKGNTVYVAVTDGALTQIMACDVNNGDTRIIGAYDNNPTITKNYAFTHAVISPSDNALTGVIEVFDPITENFVRTDYFGETLYFGVSRHCFEVNGRFYTVANGFIIPTDSIAAMAEIEYKKSLSSVYTVTDVRREYITICSSVYSRANLAAELVFGVYSENCTEAQKQAFIGAVGVNNALALGKCREAGLTKPEKLVSAIEAYYSATAANAIITDCNVSILGALSYNGGSLRAIDIDDCILVINEQSGNEAIGTVYIKAGIIGGKTAYTAHKVTFVAEDGMWKLGKPIT